MKLSDKTISVLKNFAAINKSILLHEGNVIRTISPFKTVMAKATIDEEFPKEVGIYELPRFLNTLNLFEGADIEFGERYLTIESGPSKIKYAYADPSLFAAAKKKDLNITDVIQTVDLSQSVLFAIDKARKTLGLEDIALEGVGGKLYIKVLDGTGKSNDEYALELGESEKDFRAVFKSENMEVMSRDYTVSISSKGITHWKADDVEYWIVLVANTSKLS